MVSLTAARDFTQSVFIELDTLYRKIALMLLFSNLTRVKAPYNYTIQMQIVY